MKEKKYLIYGICLSLLIVIGVTLAYFITEIEGNKKDVTINTGDLRVIFNNGEKIEGIDIEPGWSVTKTFSIENKSKTEYKYNIVIQDLINTFVSDNLVYKITSTNNGHNMTDYEVLPKSETAEDTILTYSTTISGKTTQEYTIEVKFKEEDRNQYEDMGKTITGKIYITEGTTNSILLTQAILRDNPIISERTDFSTEFNETTIGTIYKTNKTEDGSDVYYYSGNTTNNWIKFGNFYWRIIRTNEDGSIRLLYSGTNPDTTEGYIAKSAFNGWNDENDDPMYVGYMYGTSGTLLNNRTNENGSIIQTEIDVWYHSNLEENYDKYISKEAIYCNDRSVGSGSYSTLTEASDEFYYGSYTRLKDNDAPSYKCGANTSSELFESTQAIADKFSASTTGGGNGQLQFPIALMTADELVFAGGGGSGQINNFAWFIANSNGNLIVNDYWWLLSPYAWDSSIAEVAIVSDSFHNGSFFGYNVNHENAVRPVISLNSCVKVTGTGTPTDPYKVDENSCS